MTRVVWMLTVAPLVVSSAGCDDYLMTTGPTGVRQLRACEAAFRNTLVFIPAPGLRDFDRHADRHHGGGDLGCNP